MNGLIFDNVCFRYGSRQIVENISFTASLGSVTCIIGPSGIGKTTLLKLACGLDVPASGRVVAVGIDHRPVRFGFVFQDPSLMPWASVLDNATYAARIDPQRSAAVRATAEQLLISFGLWDARELRPSQLSGGMQQRVALIRAIASQPDMLLLDEAFSQTDFLLRRQLLKAVHAVVSSQNAGCLLVTHDLDDATLIADEILILAGSPAHLVQKISVSVSRSDRFHDANDALVRRESLRKLILSHFEFGIGVPSV